MKPFFILLVVLSVSCTGYSQDNTPKKHEIGLSLYSYSYATTYLSGGDSYFRYAPNHQFIDGLSYKYHWGKVALRAGFNYQLHTFPNELPEDLILTQEYRDDLYWGKIWNVSSSIGVERVFGTKKVQPYVAMDVYFMYGKNDGKPAYYGNPLIDLFNYPQENIVYSGGFKPVLGISYKIINQLSIRLETSGSIGWYRQDNYGVSNGFFVNYNPISALSINFHF